MATQSLSLAIKVTLGLAIFPVPICRSRHLPLSTIRHPAVRSSPIDNEREHLSLLPLGNCRAFHRTLLVASNSHDRQQWPLLRRGKLRQQVYRSKESTIAFVLAGVAFHDPFLHSSFVHPPSLIAQFASEGKRRRGM